MANQKPKRISQVIQSPPRCICQTRKPLGDSKPKDVCETCGGSGWLRNDAGIWDEDFGKMTRCACKATEDARSLQDKIGTKVEDVGLHSLLDRGAGSKKMIAELNRLLETPRAGGFLTIWGSNGNGKSTALMAAVNYCLDKDVPAIYFTATEFTEYIKEGIDDVFNVENRLRQISNIPFLSIDELSDFLQSDYNKDKIGRLIDNRYRAGNSTLIALDGCPAEHLHQRIISRLMTGTIIQNNDSDLRLILGGG